MGWLPTFSTRALRVQGAVGRKIGWQLAMRWRGRILTLTFERWFR